MSPRTVVHFIDTDTFGGAERALLHVMDGLDRQRWRPVLWHHDAPGLQPVRAHAHEHEIATRVVPSVHGLSGLAHVPAFVRALRDEQPAIFHAHLNWPLGCAGGILAAAWRRVPAVVATVQLFGSLPLHPSVHLLRRLVPPAVDRYVAVSEEVKRRLQTELHLKADTIRVIPNMIDLAPFEEPGPSQASLRASLGVDPDRPLVLCVARLETQKGHRYLVDAAARVPEAVFVLAGDGPDRAALEAQAAHLGLGDRVIFLGFRQDVHALLNACTLFVLPSLYEGLPLSVLEAMAAGKPVVATDIGGTSEAVLHDETGLLVPPAQPAALAEAIRHLLTHPARARQLAEAGKKRVHGHFSARKMTQAVAALYEELLEGK